MDWIKVSVYWVIIKLYISVLNELHSLGLNEELVWCSGKIGESFIADFSSDLISSHLSIFD